MPKLHGPNQENIMKNKIDHATKNELKIFIFFGISKTENRSDQKEKTTMIIANIFCRLAIFGDFESLEYSKENLFKAMNSFIEPVTPRIVQEQHSDGSISQRMQLVLKNGMFVVTIASGYIDVQYTTNKKTGFESSDLPTVRKEMNNALKKVYTAFSNQVNKPCRLAWNTTYMCFDMTDEERDSYRNQFLVEPTFFKENRMNDTLIRYGCQKTVPINYREEKINAIVTVTDSGVNLGSGVTVNGYKIDYDINTWQGDQNCRFDTDDLNEFVKKSAEIQKEMDDEMLPEIDNVVIDFAGGK